MVSLGVHKNLRERMGIFFNEIEGVNSLPISFSFVPWNELKWGQFCL